MTSEEVVELRHRRNQALERLHQLEFEKATNDQKRDEVADTIERLNDAIFTAEIERAIMPIMPIKMEIIENEQNFRQTDAINQLVLQNQKESKEMKGFWFIKSPSILILFCAFFLTSIGIYAFEYLKVLEKEQERKTKTIQQMDLSLPANMKVVKNIEQENLK